MTSVAASASCGSRTELDSQAAQRAEDVACRRRGMVEQYWKCLTSPTLGRGCVAGLLFSGTSFRVFHAPNTVFHKRSLKKDRLAMLCNLWTACLDLCVCVFVCGGMRMYVCISEIAHVC